MLNQERNLKIASLAKGKKEHTKKQTKKQTHKQQQQQQAKTETKEQHIIIVSNNSGSDKTKI